MDGYTHRYHTEGSGTDNDPVVISLTFIGSTRPDHDGIQREVASRGVKVDGSGDNLTLRGDRDHRDMSRKDLLRVFRDLERAHGWVGQHTA